jgi:hypothetical protein
MATAFQRLPAERAFIKPQLLAVIPHYTFLSDSNVPTATLVRSSNRSKKFPLMERSVKPVWQRPFSAYQPNEFL